MRVDTQKADVFSLLESERDGFTRIAESSLYVTTQEEFCRWSQREVQAVFPHGMLICGAGRMGAQAVEIQHVVNCNFPDAYAQTLRGTDGLTGSPIIARWMRENRPILYEPGDETTESIAPPGWKENFQKFGLTNLAAHGLRDLDHHTASYFSFSCIPGRLTPRHASLLELVVPYLHVALMRVVAGALESRRPPSTLTGKLTTREREILQWISLGKSNPEIARLAGLSESTVKNHVHKILGKLQVNSRAQAAAWAVSTRTSRS